jgi:hypothetical protein
LSLSHGCKFNGLTGRQGTFYSQRHAEALQSLFQIDDGASARPNTIQEVLGLIKKQLIAFET